LTHRYRDARGFAKLIVSRRGTAIAHGADHGWCFLIRTPEIIEGGVRVVLKRGLHGRSALKDVARPHSFFD
jgi:hypothetical protein